MRAVGVLLVFTLIAAACASEPQNLTCDLGEVVEVSGQEADEIGLWSGLYSSKADTEGAAAKCFSEGRQLGSAEMSCAVIDELRSGDYTLLYTDEDGVTSEVDPGSGIAFPPDYSSLAFYARKFPFLSACPDLVPPLD